MPPDTAAERIPLGPCPRCGRPMVTTDPEQAARVRATGWVPRCTPCAIIMAGIG